MNQPPTIKTLDEKIQFHQEEIKRIKSAIEYNEIQLRKRQLALYDLIYERNSSTSKYDYRIAN